MVTLETIFEKSISELTNQEKDYLVEHESQLTTEQKEMYKQYLESEEVKVNVEVEKDQEEILKENEAEGKKVCNECGQEFNPE